jgi:hypothetical protein
MIDAYNQTDASPRCVPLMHRTPSIMSSLGNECHLRRIVPDVSTTAMIGERTFLLRKQSDGIVPMQASLE